MTRVQHFLILTCIAGGAPIDKHQVEFVLDSFDPPSSRRWSLIGNDRFLVGWIGGDVVDASGGFMLWAGDLLRPSAKPIEPNRLGDIASCRTKPDGCWDGAFAALIVDPVAARALVVADRFGLFPVYSFEQDGVRCYSTSLRTLTSVMRPVCHLDMQSVYEMLGLGMVLGDRTFLSEVRLVSPATFTQLGSDKPASARYWDWSELSDAPFSSPRDLVHETYDLIEKAVLRAIPSGARVVGVPLSGGLDSRMLCAVLARNQVEFRTYNIDFDQESPIARRVAATLGAPIRVFPFLDDPRSWVSEAHAAIDCAYQINQVWGWKLAQWAATVDNCDVLLDGLAFDSLLGAYHRVDTTGAVQMAADLAHYRMVGTGLFELVLGAGTAGAIDESLRSSLEDTARVCLDEAGPLASTWFLMNNRVRRYTFGYCLANQQHVRYGFPYITRELFAHCVGLPLDERAESTLYRRIYRQMFPELARIPWAKTGVPLDRFPRKSTYRKAKDWISRAVSRGTLGRIDIEQSLDANFRRRSEVRAAMRLHSKDRSDSLSGLPREAFEKAVQLHLSGRNLIYLIHNLYTVEHFVSRFVNEYGVTLAKP